MPNVEMSPAQLQQILEAVLAKANQLNPLEQKRYDEEMAKQRRRDLLAVEIGRAEQQATLARRNACSHMRDGKTGDSVPRGWPTGEWTTGGQAYQNGLAMMFCSRCQSQWWFKPTPEYHAAILQNGLRSSAPPPDDQCICIGCYEQKTKCRCSEIAKEHAAAHPTVA